MVDCIATAKQFWQTTCAACWNYSDLERNSADAIAPAMTSSALLPHQSDGGRLLNFTASCGAALRCVLSRTAQPRLTNPKENPSNLAQLPSFGGHLSRFGFSGEGPFRALFLEGPKVPRGTGDYSQHLVDVKRETLHIVFYSGSG